jgi:hypothetical protein
MSDPRPTPVPPRRLPQQPNLEQLKKQAKELLERFRASELTAIAEVRQFERSPDPPASPSTMRNAFWPAPMASRAGRSSKPLSMAQPSLASPMP